MKALAIIIIGAIVVVTLFALTMQDSPARQPTQALIYDHVLVCAECAVAGQQAYIYSSQALDKLQCRAVWGAKVAIISRHGDVLQVDVQDWCRGYVAASLVK